MAIDLSQFQNLDTSNIGGWPPLVKGVVIALICVVVIAGGYWFDTQDQLSDLHTAQQKEQKLKKEFETKQAKAANLNAYKRQMKEMKDTFGTLLRQLPNRNEVADLLVDITQAGLSNGLEFNLFKPQKEQRKEFYAELPISLQVVGGYHQFGAFVSAVAALPRIVTMANVHIHEQGKAGGPLTMDATATTYRYLEASEMTSPDKKKRK